MARPPAESLPLPIPSDRIAAWFGGFVVSAWAVGVQSFADPMKQIFAIASPGVGYVAGHGLQKILEINRARVEKNNKRALIKKLDASIEALSLERMRAINDGDSPAFISEIEDRIRRARSARLRLLGDETPDEG